MSDPLASFDGSAVGAHSGQGLGNGLQMHISGKIDISYVGLEALRKGRL